MLRATNGFGNQIVVVARWLEGGTEYLFCRDSTSKPEVYRRGPFEEACRAAAIDDSPAFEQGLGGRGRPGQAGEAMGMT